MYKLAKFLFLAGFLQASLVFGHKKYMTPYEQNVVEWLELDALNLQKISAEEKSFFWFISHIKSELSLEEQRLFMIPFSNYRILLESSESICLEDKAIIAPYSELMRIMLAESSQEGLRRLASMIAALHVYAYNLPMELATVIEQTLRMLDASAELVMSEEQLLEQISKLEKIIQSSYILILNFLPELTIQEQQLVIFGLEETSQALYGDSKAYLQFEQQLCGADKEQLRPLIKRILTEICNLFYPKSPDDKIDSSQRPNCEENSICRAYESQYDAGSNPASTQEADSDTAAL
jgi:hypothetical protein